MRTKLPEENGKNSINLITKKQVIKTLLPVFENSHLANETYGARLRSDIKLSFLVLHSHPSKLVPSDPHPVCIKAEGSAVPVKTKLQTIRLDLI